MQPPPPVGVQYVQSTLPPSRMFYRRSALYKFGLIGMTISCFLFLVSFSISSWAVVPRGSSAFFIRFDESRSIRPWVVSFIGNGNTANAIIAASVILAFCLIGYFFCIIFGLVVNCCRFYNQTYNHTRKLEIGIFITATLGFIGNVIFLVAVVAYGCQLRPGYFMNTVALVILVVAGILIYRGNAKGSLLNAPVVQQPTATVVQYSSGVPGLTPQPQVMYTHPPQTVIISQTQPMYPPAPSQPMYPAPPAYSAPPTQPLAGYQPPPMHGYTPVPQAAGQPPAYSYPPMYPGDGRGYQPVPQSDPLVASAPPSGEAPPLPRKN